MAEFVEVMKNKNRMCEAQESCGRCPIEEIKDTYCMTCPELMKKIPEKVEEIVMKWEKEHPIQTNEDKFFETFGFRPKIRRCLLNTPCAPETCKYHKENKCWMHWWDEEYKAPTEEVSE